jgi:hypothetical protein
MIFGNIRYYREKNSFIMDRMIKTFLLVALCMALILTPAGTSAASDVNISVTIAIGGVACGVYFFISYTVDYISGWKPFQTETALLQCGPEGWRVACPHLKFIEDSPSSYAPYVEIINVRF